ncbi:hypothetical protein R1flu_007873 [Riccia fluitans]|uniref:Uncharacterized protein n=1 Tax=Riccia fluitans TaxID=41844 RepID=A0ABD1Z031_9MARC
MGNIFRLDLVKSCLSPLLGRTHGEIYHRSSNWLIHSSGRKWIHEIQPVPGLAVANACKHHEPSLQCC